jgi:hypothetical protein
MVQTPPNPSERRWNAVAVGVAAFALALSLRVRFLSATPDAAWAHSALFKGDAHVWLDYAGALRAGEPFELGLPLRPPGTAYLLAAVWDGQAEHVLRLRLLWAGLGALTVGCLALWAARAWGTLAGLVTGIFAASSTSLLLLSSSLDSETPYLALVAGSMLLVGHPPTLGRGASWSALQGVACLFRVEHLLFVVLAAAWWLGRSRGELRASRRGLLRPALVSLAAFALVLLPWHVHAWRAISRFNTAEPVRSPAEERALRQLERSVSGMDWDAAALQARAALPAFTRRTSADFVAATVAWRGGRRVSGPDFGALEDAFGSLPRPLAAHPFVALYGPLNFALANHADADGGFSRAPLERAPPLRPGRDAYPPELVSFLPPPDLTFAYPPHLSLANDGFGIGARWIAENPAGFARLVSAKLRVFLSGVSLGVGGYGWPLGLSGTRRPVDFTVPEESGVGWAWRALLLALLVVALRAVPRPVPAALAAWGLFALSKIVVTAAFFGYARQGALLVPLVALLIGAATAAVVRSISERQARTALIGLALLVLGAESVRALRPPVLSIDGVVVGAAEPAAEDLHRVQRVVAH